jgi:hypothetical protein
MTMCTDEKTDKQTQIQVQLVDNWHARWREVLDAIDYLGQRPSLNIDTDGWLSARHNLLVAFAEDESIAGHLSFRVQPVKGSDGMVVTDAGRPLVEAQLESLGVQPGFSREEVEAMLREEAQRRAHALRCRQLVGFN